MLDYLGLTEDIEVMRMGTGRHVARTENEFHQASHQEGPCMCFILLTKA